ncbi:DNA polymerase III chi subunit [Comamonas sp. BIGb0124]|uniref:DNA polymerase III subunit chi n=1 Tax=Comamonas sp. BIGb0124 TaxID=2485130 RepID=UPI000F4A1B73|nr:DNA polymerase III subunit chi [Comamonas sp. BIGb0124]ROR20146.1 DNA polymerase III chi subunit [Comamonas sp. BIGb0124]
MTRIDFHSNVADRCAYACRLLRKAAGQGARLLVVAEEPLLDRLDQALWNLSDTEFLPHCRSVDAAEMLAASPIVLHDAGAAEPPDLQACSVLVNLGQAVPPGFERFERLVEILGRPELDAEGVAQGRRRWKHYKDRGYALHNHASP